MKKNKIQVKLTTDEWSLALKKLGVIPDLIPGLAIALIVAESLKDEKETCQT